MKKLFIITISFMINFSFFISITAQEGPFILVAENNSIRELNPGESFPLLNKTLKKLDAKFGIKFDKTLFKGFLVHKRDEDNPLFELKFNDPLIKPFLRVSPYQLISLPSEMQNDQDKLFAEVEVATVPLYGSAAIDLINMIYLDIEEEQAPIYKNANGVITSSFLEMVLHEAIHFYHYNNPNQVSDLLHSAGSYYDKIQATTKICEHFREARSEIDCSDNPKCEGYSNEEVIRKILIDVKWPSRFGPSSSRHLYTKLPSNPAKMSFYKNKIISRFEYKGKEYIELKHDWDAHAFDDYDGGEYFAILMQLYIFSPDDFFNIATEEEQKFAQSFFKNTFGLVQPSHRMN